MSKIDVRYTPGALREILHKKFDGNENAFGVWMGSKNEHLGGSTPSMAMASNPGVGGVAAVTAAAAMIGTAKKPLEIVPS